MLHRNACFCFLGLNLPLSSWVFDVAEGGPAMDLTRKVSALALFSAFCFVAALIVGMI